MIIGIPRALYTYKHPGLWHGLVHGLGLAHMVSPRTNAAILAKGLALSDGEACLACKVFMGHCAWLRSRGAEALLVPRYKSQVRGYHCCPKFFGLPDVVRVLFPGVTVFEPEVSSRRPLSATLWVAGIRLGGNMRDSFRAARTACMIHRRTLQRMAAAYAACMHRPLTVALVTHPYTLHDPYVNMRIAHRLRQRGVTAVPVDSVAWDRHAPTPDIRWDFARELIARANALINAGVHGIIQLSSCNCGCDAVIREYVHASCLRAHVPYMGLIIDEHTTDGGLQTRLEAFVDTLTNRELHHAACA
jgi:predicted nucleotide-binding protein (sugar kinase/HSP70/actin superfamily)